MSDEEKAMILVESALLMRKHSEINRAWLEPGDKRSTDWYEWEFMADALLKRANTIIR